MSEVPQLSLCRGCCCGTAAKRPDVDHEAQRVRLDELSAQGVVAWRETECLGPCDDANVLVVHPTQQARARGARPVWLARVCGDQLEVVIQWVTAGGPGSQALPPSLSAYLIPRARRPGPP